MTELHIELLGGLRLRTPAGRHIRIVSRKAQALLGCLALAPGVAHSRDVLAGLLWEDSDPELARASLRQALASLRRSLPPAAAAALQGDGGNVVLDARLVTSDVAQLHGLLRDGSPGALARAVEQHAGVLLDGLDARSAAFEQWLLERRGELRRLLLSAAERAATQCAAVGDDAGAIAALTRLVGIEPSNERAQRELMEALARQGRYTDALRQYRACRDALRRDLDVAPEPATDALHRELLRRRRAAMSDAGATAEADTLHEKARGWVQVTPADAAMEVATPVEATLREVVILVARASNAPASADDPESARNAAVAAHARVARVVERQGGRVERPTEGETLAVFGLAALAGNEIEHAARAALELASDDTSVAASGLRFAVGLAQGQVLPVSEAQPFPLAGRPVTQARELARAVRPGEVAATAEISWQIAGRYTLAALPGAATSGAQLVLATGHATRAPTERQIAGRRAELAMLQTLLERVAATRRARAVILRGDAGIGKSCLLAELATAARHRETHVYEVQVLDFGQAASERPAPALTARLLGVAREASDRVRDAAVDAAVENGALPTGDRLLARDLLGIAPGDGDASTLSAMDAGARERGRARVLHRLVQAAATRATLLVIVEDIHWAAGVEVAQLADLAAAAATLPLLLALSVRADADPTGPAWRARARGCPVTTLDLAPLADDEARELAGRFPGLPADVVEACLEKAAGHPLFLDQLLRSAQTGQASLPGSVRGLLLARVDRLPQDLQRGLHAAAVLGSRFSRGALQHVLAEPAYDLGRLEQAGLIAADGEECRFAHALIRAAVYESLLRSTRQELHRRSAAWYESRDPGLQADHLAAAEDPTAPAAYLRAAAEEQRASRLDRALAHAERSRELGRSPSDLCAAFARIGDLSLTRGRTDDAIAAYRESIDLAAASAERARGWLGLATSLRVVDRYDEALGALRQAEQAAAAEADPRLLAQLWTLRGNLHFPRGELDACLEAHRRALSYAEQADSPEDVARALGGLGDAQYQRGRMRTAQAEFGRCVALCEQHRFAGLRLSYLPMLGVTAYYMGDFRAAREISAQSSAAAALAGDLRTQLLSTSVNASVEIYQARYREAVAAAERSIALAREIGARRFEAEGLILLGLALLGLGRRGEAQETLGDSVALTRAAAQTYCGPWALAALALTVDEAQASALLQEGEGWLVAGCVSHNYLEFYRYAIQVCLHRGDRDGAERYAAALEAYTRDEPLPWANVVIAAGRALARRASAGARARAGLDAALAGARDMEFNELVVQLESGGPA